MILRVGETYVTENTRPLGACWVVLPHPDFDDVRLADSERTWLAKACPFFATDYFDYLAKFRFKPEQDKAVFRPKDPSKLTSRYQPPPYRDNVREGYLASSGAGMSASSWSFSATFVAR